MCYVMTELLIYKALGLQKYSTYATYLCNLLWSTYGILKHAHFASNFFFPQSTPFEPIHSSYA